MTVARSVWWTFTNYTQPTKRRVRNIIHRTTTTHGSQSINDRLRHGTVGKRGRCLHSGDITLEVTDDGVEVSDQLLLEKLNQYSTRDRRSRLTWPVFSMTFGGEVGVIWESALAALPETVVAIPMLSTTCWTVSPASAPWEIRATEAKVAMMRNNILKSRC
jgi:hypothetical protein